MKRNSARVFCRVIVCVFCALCFSCATMPRGAEWFNTTDIDFKDVMGKTWKLQSIGRDGVTVFFDRAAVETDEVFANMLENMYTILFGDKRLSGKGVVNNFFSPYTLGARQSISIDGPAATLMFPFKEPEQLKENEYFVYIRNVSAWTVRGGKLYLLTRSSDDADVVLEFAD